MKIILALLFLTTPLFALSPDTSASSFDDHVQKKRIDVYDFSGTYPNLENIDVDAKRKKNVEFNLSGQYPVLETLNYEGTFGNLIGNLTGSYPKLNLVNFMCTSCAMELDLTGDWKQSCAINIRGMKENVELKLPENVGLIIHTHVGARGKVVVRDDLKKKGWLGIFNKTYRNKLAETSPVVLEMNIETTDGLIILE